MKIREAYILLALGSLLLLTNSCIKEIDFDTESFESALVIEAVVTNELKTQEVLLSRTYRFDERYPNPEVAANVEVIGGNIIFQFEELEPGKYTSKIDFSARANIEYSLIITRSNGRSYTSSPTLLTRETEIENLYAERETNDDGINGMSIYVDTFDPTASSEFYSFEYIEMYKIIAPRWVPQDAIVTGSIFPDCLVELVPKTEEKRVCYGLVESNKIIQASTEGLQEDRLSRFLIRFIDSESYWLAYRYGIIVKQFVRSKEAYNYYETLNNFNLSQSLFSQIQAGFFEGNIISEDNPKEKVIGFFEVSSVSEKRLFFNYDDFYPNDPPPLFPSGCIDLFPDLFITNQDHIGTCGDLISGIESNSIVFYELNNNAMTPYLMISRECGDCTALGSNVVPEYWVD